MCWWALSSHLSSFLWLIYAEKECKYTLTNSKNVGTNDFLGRAWLEHFEKKTLNKDIVDFIINVSITNKPMQNKLIVNEILDYEFKINGSEVN